MAKIDKYSLTNLKADFPNEEACLNFIFDTLHSHQCSCGGEYKLLKSRRQFQCSKCRYQIAPTARTIFEKSSTPLNLWFHALFIFSNAKSGISAKEMERQLGVTYKCAWRILKLIRESLKQDRELLGGSVEIDEAYFGGRFRSGKGNKRQREAMAAKSPIIAAVERGGRMKAEVSPDITTPTITSFIWRNVNLPQARVLTDESNRYDIGLRGFRREKVAHKAHKFVRGDVHINNVESFWSHIKRSVKGTHKVISKKHLQSYLDGFVWHYNNRHNDKDRFASLLGAVLSASRV